MREKIKNKGSGAESSSRVHRGRAQVRGLGISSESCCKIRHENLHAQIYLEKCRICDKGLLGLFRLKLNMADMCSASYHNRNYFDLNLYFVQSQA